MPSTTITINWQQLSLVFCILLTLLLAYLSLAPPAVRSEPAIGEHYARLVIPYVAQRNEAELTRLMASFVADKRIVKGGIYSVTGEQLALQGASQSISALLRESPTLRGHRLPLYLDTNVIGYLQWVSDPSI